VFIFVHLDLVSVHSQRIHAAEPASNLYPLFFSDKLKKCRGKCDASEILG